MHVLSYACVLAAIWLAIFQIAPSTSSLCDYTASCEGVKKPQIKANFFSSTSSFSEFWSVVFPKCTARLCCCNLVSASRAAATEWRRSLYTLWQARDQDVCACISHYHPGCLPLWRRLERYLARIAITDDEHQLNTTPPDGGFSSLCVHRAICQVKDPSSSSWFFRSKRHVCLCA